MQPPIPRVTQAEYTKNAKIKFKKHNLLRRHMPLEIKAITLEESDNGTILPAQEAFRLVREALNEASLSLSQRQIEQILEPHHDRCYALRVDHILQGITEEGRRWRYTLRGKTIKPRSQKETTHQDAMSAYISDLKKIPLMTYQEELCCARRIQAGDEEARDEMIQRNLRFVVNLAKRKLYHGKKVGMELCDLVQAGNTGLIRAAEKYDPERGTRFTTYASFWIKQAIQRKIAEHRYLKIPMNRLELLGKARKAKDLLRIQLGREPTHQEISYEIGTSENELRLIERSYQAPVSLERLKNQTAAPDRLDERVNHTAVREIIQALGSRERSIIERRYGIGGYSPQTLEEIGHAIGLSRERVRQLEIAVIGMMRDPSIARKIAPLYEE